MKLRSKDGGVVEASQTADRYLSQGWVEFYDDGCPTCGAVDDEPCVTSSGNPTGPHAARTE